MLGSHRNELGLLLLLFSRLLGPNRGKLGLALLLLACVFGLRRGKLGFALFLTLRPRGILLLAPLFLALLFFALRLPLRFRSFLSGELGLALLLLLRLRGRLLLAFQLLALLLLGLCSLSRALAFDLFCLFALTFGFLACLLLARAGELGLLPFALEPLGCAFTSRLRVHRSS